MKRIAVIFLASYFLLGQMLLPNGDFSILPDLQSMYTHCKETEDKDLTVFDFITDHLLDIDGVFDAHENGDDQKPHKPFNLTHPTSNLTLITHRFEPHIIRFDLVFKAEMKDDLPMSKQHFYHDNYLSTIFRPPIFV
jgi:hypothetical protein